jgi:hypothetical protein
MRRAKVLQLYRPSDVLQDGHKSKPLEAKVNRTVVLYLATLIVLIPVDFLFLGLVAKGFFSSQVGDMLGEVRLAPRSCSICCTSPVS